MKIKFLGAAGCVTGSCTLLQYSRGNIRFLVDCGMTQGEGNSDSINHAPWPFVGAKISFVLLTHAHLDHCGLLPKLIREGFCGPVYCTRFTGKLARLNLLSAAAISGELFTKTDVEKIRFSYIDANKDFLFGKYLSIIPEMEIAFYPTAHIGGACSIGIKWKADDSSWRETIFSGDLGPSVPENCSQLLLASRECIPSQPNHLIVESTYGNRERSAFHADVSRRLSELQRILLTAMEKINPNEKICNTIVIPCFSIHRTQEVLVDLHVILENYLYNKITWQPQLVYSDPEQVEEALQNGIRPKIVESMLPDDAVRFRKYFKLENRKNGQKKTKEVFYPLDNKLSEAREFLLQVKRSRPYASIKVIVDSSLAQSVTKIYRDELKRRSPGSLEKLQYRNEKLKTYFGVTEESCVDTILDRLFLDAQSKDNEPVTESFLNYNLVFCHYSQSEDVLKDNGLNIVISSSGMADFGPVVSHLKYHLTNANATVVLTGFAPSDTITGQLREYFETGKIGSTGRLNFNDITIMDFEIQATIEDLGPYYSGHADQKGLLDFIFSIPTESRVTSTTTTVFLNHGNELSREALRDAIMQRNAENNPDERSIAGVELPAQNQEWFDLKNNAWLPVEPVDRDDAINELLLRLLIEQRRTNDLLNFLIQRCRREQVNTKPSSHKLTKKNGSPRLRG